jgi:3-deoxy-7-phosphoheptulonate synthase
MTLSTPEEIRSELAITARAASTVASARAEIEAIIDGRDDRLLVVVGPCSIHDPLAALEYAEKLGKLRARYADALLICMRGYFEKPRTTVGWKGLINDPHLDGSCDVAAGLRMARGLLLQLAELGMPTANEALDPVTPQYMMDLISWSAIGARTTESQTHREMASGLSMPVGFKNGTDGGLDVAINAMKSACQPHSFIGINGQGVVSVVRTLGNPYSHAVLRGGTGSTNYAELEVNAAAERLAKAGVNARVLVDVSHGNSQKKYENQPRVAAEVARQVAQGSRKILGVMIESHLVAGQQELVPGQALVYGQSITDACIDFASTEGVLEGLARSVASARSTRAEATH